MFCTHCGARLDAAATFCSACGTRTDGAPGDRGRPGVVWGVWGIVILLALLLVGGSGAWLLTRGPSSSSASTGTEALTSSTPPTPSTSGSPSSPPSSPSSPSGATPTASPTALTFPALYEQSSDGVVRVETSACEGGGVGSGFLIAPDLVATVAHVVEDSVSIAIRQGSTVTSGTVIGLDADTDLALVRSGKPLTGHVFSLDQEEPEVGADVAAIGYPLGGPESLTKGSVSGLGRTIDVDGTTLDDLIQTDAGINLGNSGGPLLDTTGTVVGLVDATATHASGIAYAIPAAAAVSSLDDWRAHPQDVSTSGCDTPTAPDDVSVIVDDHTGSEDGPDVTDLFTTYADAINVGDYTTAFGRLSPAARDRVDFDDFASGNETSFIITFDIDDITARGGDRQVRARFTSVQDSSAGSNGQTCSQWTMTYALVPGDDGWLIDHAVPDPGSPTAC